MEINILTRLRSELESFNLVITANLVGAASAIAYIIAQIIVISIPSLTGSAFNYKYLPYLIVIICGFATAFTWRIRNAELMDEYNHIVKRLDEIITEQMQTDGQDFDEQFISIIVESLAFYRENSVKINRLKWIGRLTGTFLLLVSVPQLVSFITSANTLNSLYILAQLFLVFFSIGVSIVAWYIPTLINRFMYTWDSRLMLAEDANNQIKRFLEDNL
jgi:hypothetical protein